MEEQDRAKEKGKNKAGTPRILTGVFKPGKRTLYRQTPAVVQLVNSSGLCNRLRGWVGIGALADLAGATFVCHWRPMSQCRSRFYDIFVPDNCLALNAASQCREFQLVKRFSKKRAVLSTHKYLQHVSRAVFNEAAIARQRSLRLQPKWADRLEEFMETVPADAIGVHVRRTDLVPPPLARRSDAHLYAKMDAAIAHNPEATFLCCADNPRSVQRLRDRYGDRIFWREQKMRDHRQHKHRYTSQANAAIDLFALSRMKRIIGTKRSSFSLFAARTAGIKAEMV